jgi:hypothetical protein
VPYGRDTDGPEGGGGNGGRGESLRERMSRRFLKPADPSAPHAEAAPPPTVDELEAANRYANDKERFIGLLAAPVAAAIGFLVIDADIANDPAQYLKSGRVNPDHTSVALDHVLLLVLLGLAVVMLAAAWFRKRLFLGMATALYGLSLFNLDWWGFGVPFMLVGAWYLVRAYRAQQAVRAATGGGPPRGSSGRGGGPASSRPKPSKRYTPPTSR